MTGSGTCPEFLILRLPGGDLDAAQLDAAATAVAGAGGEVLALAPSSEVELLEPGSPAAAVLVARWPASSAFDAAWTAGVEVVVDGLVRGRGGALALAAQGLPPEGLPDQLEVPTVASVPVEQLPTPPTYMVIQGSVTDTERIAGYRNIILPMMMERGSLYVVFCIGGSGVRVLRGEWDEQIFAISRWPTHAAAHDFWYSERYQREAIPIRTGIGAFHVHLLRGRAG